MQARARTLGYLALLLSIACVASTCEASVRFRRAADSGQARDLINRPSCEEAESYAPQGRCDVRD
jgi:hypothetical protein